MERFSIITKNPREIVLLKSKPCFWGKCSFCDYTLDNTTDILEGDKINAFTLKKVTGKYGALEVINSASVFELSPETLSLIKDTCLQRGIQKLYFETHWAYHQRLSEITKYFPIPIVFKCGIETFDNDFRNNVLKKGAYFDTIEEVANYIDSICLLVGVKGQTKKMIEKDIEIMLKYFKYGCVNIFTKNTTLIEPDYELISWFRENYAFLSQYDNIDLLWLNTDFGIGG